MIQEKLNEAKLESFWLQKCKINPLKIFLCQLFVGLSWQGAAFFYTIQRNCIESSEETYSSAGNFCYGAHLGNYSFLAVLG